MTTAKPNKQVIVEKPGLSGFICAGPVIGVWTLKEINKLIEAHHKAGGKGNPPGIKPEMSGHKKRKGCGYDLADIISEIDQDGAVYEVECPRCGNVVSVRRTPPDPVEPEADSTAEG